MLPAITHLFAENSDLDTLPARVATHYESLYTDIDVYNGLPILNAASLESLPTGTVVRYLAMVQDTSIGPELYLARQIDGSCGGWGFCVKDLNDHPDVDHLRQRAVFWAVSIPGQSPWIDQTSVDSASPPLCPYKYPLVGDVHIGVQVKIYDRNVSESIKTTDLQCFVGILTQEPLVFEEDAITLAPTIHVLFSRPLPTTILDFGYPMNFPPPIAKEDLRDEIITWLAEEALSGDRDAAEWVLLCALGRVEHRHPPFKPFSLTISNFPTSTRDSKKPALCHALSMIFPMLVTIPLSLDTLCNTSFVPESVHETLNSGWLQLPRGSVCVLTEMGISEGLINEKALSNLRAIQQAMGLQMLDYQFPYSTFPFPTDISFLVVTEGKTSTFFQTDIVISLKPQVVSQQNCQVHPSYREAKQIESPGQHKLEMYRQLIGGARLARLSEIHVSEQMAKIIQEDFVQQRQEAMKSQQQQKGHGPQVGYSPEILVQRMVLAKLITASLHDAELSLDVWKRTGSLDTRRRHRLAEVEINDPL